MKMAPDGAILDVDRYRRSAGALAAHDHGAVGQPLPHAHRAAALAAHGDALTPVNTDIVAVPPTVPLADPDADAGAFHPDTLRRHRRDRGGNCHDRRGRKAEQCCAHVPLHRCFTRQGKCPLNNDQWLWFQPVVPSSGVSLGAAQRSRSSWLSLATRSNASPALLMRYW